MKRGTKLTKRIEGLIDWKRVETEQADYRELDEEGEQYIGRSYLGSVMMIMPSGKYWTAWAASNVNKKEQEKDSRFSDSLEFVAAKHGMWIESGEGDACDLFICKAFPIEEVIE